MILTFITKIHNVTYEEYLKLPKSKLEWRLTEKLAGNPKLLKAFHRTLSHPQIPHYSNVDTLENQDQNMI